jgi:hypothetical protein
MSCCKDLLALESYLEKTFATLFARDRIEALLYWFGAQFCSRLGTTHA